MGNWFRLNTHSVKHVLEVYHTSMKKHALSTVATDMQLWVSCPVPRLRPDLLSSTLKSEKCMSLLGTFSTSNGLYFPFSFPFPWVWTDSFPIAWPPFKLMLLCWNSPNCLPSWSIIPFSGSFPWDMGSWKSKYSPLALTLCEEWSKYWIASPSEDPNCGFNFELCWCQCHQHIQLMLPLDHYLSYPSVNNSTRSIRTSKISSKSPLFQPTR